MTTLHVLSNFSVPTNLTYEGDPFAAIAYRYIKHMSAKGYNFIHYGTTGSNPPCENVIIPFKDWTQMNNDVGRAIQLRKKPGDLILSFYGTGNQNACAMNGDLKVIEPAIGYAVDTVFAQYRVFTSTAHEHMYYGHHKMLMNPSWFDAVIPNGFEVDEFYLTPKKDDYLLYFGRVIHSKGVEACIQLAERTGHKLIIAGPGSLKEMGLDKVPDHVEEVGICDAKKRADLMSRAKALLAPTYYIEPFGNMVVEAHLSGTPTITSDWGGFIDTNIEGVTGYRCRSWRDFVRAIENIKHINPEVCRIMAEERYSNVFVHAEHDRYLKKVINGNFYDESL